MPANVKAGVIQVNKAFEGITEQEIKEFYQHLSVMEAFCRNTRASDGCIKNILTEVENTKRFIAEYNTAFTLKEPDASVWAGWFN